MLLAASELDAEGKLLHVVPLTTMQDVPAGSGSVNPLD